MPNRTELSEFTFKFSGYGHYKITHKSPKTGKESVCVTSNMTLIDATKNSENPKQKDLNQLKRICKR